MATHNVQTDYGAVGDGSTDDTEAIQRAINATSPGDTVLLPKPDDHYRVTASGTNPAVTIIPAADNVTITGADNGSMVKIDRDGGSGIPAPMGAEDFDSVNWQSIQIKNLIFDGGKEINGDSFGWWWGIGRYRTGFDVLIEDCIFQNAVRSGMGTYNYGISKLTIRNCTARDNGGHGFNPTGTNAGSTTDPDVKFINVKSNNNGGTAIDFHDGYHKLDGFYGKGNYYGMKGGAGAGGVKGITLRNVNHRDSNHRGFYQTFSDSNTWELILDNCQFIGHLDNGLVLGRDGSVTVKNTVLVDKSGGADNTDYGIILSDTCSLDATDPSATVAVQNTVNGPGIRTVPNGSGTIGTYRYSGNADGALDNDSGELSVTDFVNEETSELNVPGPNDVGAFARSSDDDSDSSDDDSSTSDALIFDDWTPKWDSDQDSWSVNTASSNIEGTVLELDASSSGRHALSCDSIGTATDVDLLGLVRLPSDDDNSSSWCRLVGRGAGTAGSETGYFTAFRDVPNLEIVKYADGDSAVLAYEDMDFTPGTWFYVRFNISGNELKARYWRYDEEEPTEWNLTATDSEITDAGWVGAGGWSTDTQQWDTFSVATGGDTAEFVGKDSAPSISWQTPAGDTTVSDTATVQVAASDTEDSDDSLAVEYRVDDGSWTPMIFDSDSGYYEDSWDTTTATDGDHTLEAVVVDAGGNESTATVSVQTDNSDSGPNVDSLSLSEIETDNPDAEFDADWQVSDTDGDLLTADLTLVQQSDGLTEDETTVQVNGESATGTTRLVAEGSDGSSRDYTVDVVVTDEQGNTATDTASTTETENSSSAPNIQRFSISEAGRPDPHAEISAVWNVSGSDNDLATVNIDITDSDGTVKGVTWRLSGSEASDMDSFRVKNGDGQSFDVTLTVTDESGQSTVQKESITA
jgi:hypothetical protein